MNAWAIFAAIVVGLIVNETTACCPWLAHRLVRWAAHQWSSDPETAATYAEEWARVVDDRPGKLLKLATALAFASGAIRRTIPRRLHKARGFRIKRKRGRIPRELVASRMNSPSFLMVLGAFTVFALASISAAVYGLFSVDPKVASVLLAGTFGALNLVAAAGLLWLAFRKPSSDERRRFGR